MALNVNAAGGAGEGQPAEDRTSARRAAVRVAELAAMDANAKQLAAYLTTPTGPHAKPGEPDMDVVQELAHLCGAGLSAIAELQHMSVHELADGWRSDTDNDDERAAVSLAVLTASAGSTTDELALLTTHGDVAVNGEPAPINRAVVAALPGVARTVLSVLSELLGRPATDIVDEWRSLIGSAADDR